MTEKIGILTSWFLLIGGTAAAFVFQSHWWPLAPLASLLARRLAGLSSMSRPGDIRAGLVVVFVLLCMWVDLLLSVPTWLRSAAQVAFIVLLILGVLLTVAHDIRILVTSSPRNVPPRPAEPGVASGGGTP